LAFDLQYKTVILTLFTYLLTCLVALTLVWRITDLGFEKVGLKSIPGTRKCSIQMNNSSVQFSRSFSEI